MKTLFLILPLVLMAPVSFAQEHEEFVEQIDAEARTPLWVCQASDYMGAAGMGRGSTRQEAADQALFNCQIRSKGGCSLTSCSQL
ncbi:MAG: hypothetical protein LCH90_10375 [Proteobacteria bacterium]|nr:hypothetical protein [Pseudomonadota bacterium]